MYKPKHFKLYELLPPSLYKSEGEGWGLLDERLLRTIDAVRDIVGLPLTCNNWFTGGKREMSGYRPQNSPVGAPRSQHKRGRAADLICAGMTAESMRRLIDSRKDELPYPVRIEKGVNWLHIDVGNDTEEKIYYFKA